MQLVIHDIGRQNQIFAALPENKMKRLQVIFGNYLEVGRKPEC